MEKEKYLLGVIRSLLLGVLGGWTFSFITLPLPWMLGPIAFNTIGILLGFPLRSPFKIRPIFTVVLGGMLGSGFTSEFLDQSFLIASSIFFYF